MRELLDRGEDVLEQVGTGYWPDRIAEIRERDPLLQRAAATDTAEGVPVT